MIARLSPGARIGEARADADRVARELGREFPRFNRDTEVVVTPLLAHLTAPARPALLMLLAAAALVVAATGANVTNLLLARGLTRRRDVSVRLAIGAGRLDITRQVLAEAGLIVLAGAIGGLGVTGVALLELRRLNPAVLPRLDDVRLDAPVLLFTAGLACLLAMAVGGASALQMWTMEPGDGLRESHGTATPRSRRLSHGPGPVANHGVGPAPDWWGGPGAQRRGAAARAAGRPDRRRLRSEGQPRRSVVRRSGATGGVSRATARCHRGVAGCRRRRRDFESAPRRFADARECGPRRRLVWRQRGRRH